MNTIYIDMDGVVADFNGFISEKLGRSVNWTDKDITKQEWQFLLELGNIYYKLPLMRDATKLVGYCSNITPKYNVEFLTALPSKTTMPEAAPDKTQWIKKYFPLYKVNFGPFSTDKWKWCNPGDILIDDRHSNISDWCNKGNGIAILHDGNVMKTLNRLDTVVGTSKPLIL
jgi:5'(3')-deoxyribonucleotidase